MPDLATSNLLAAIGTVLLNIGVFKLLVAMLWPESWFGRMARTYMLRLGLWAAFGFALAGTIITLYYSEYLGATPCGLCWLQRIFLYPQVVLFAIAAWRKDTSVAVYSIALSMIGAVIALYQHYLQMGGTLDVIPCPATGTAADCTARTFFEFGYITYPFMAFSLFVYLILLMYFMHSSARRSRMGENA